VNTRGGKSFEEQWCEPWCKQHLGRKTPSVIQAIRFKSGNAAMLPVEGQRHSTKDRRQAEDARTLNQPIL
jgi:hypothetical protein